MRLVTDAVLRGDFTAQTASPAPTVCLRAAPTVARFATGRFQELSVAAAPSAGGMLEIGLADWLAGLLVLAVGILAPVGILAARHGLLGRSREEENKIS